MIKSSGYDKSLLLKLIALKGVMLLVSVGVVLVIYQYFDVELPYTHILISLLVSAGVLLLWCGRVLLPFPVVEFEIFLLLISDVVMLYFLIELSGGSANPFTSSLLVPLALSAALLRKPFSLCVMLVAIAIYASWMFDGDSHAHMGHSQFSLHLYGMWINFLLSAVILFVFVTYAMDSVSNRENQLQQAREKILRDERLVAVATMTATTAHALGSPLSTMSIILEEAELDGELDDSSRRMLNEQLEICKKHLGDIGRATRSGEADAAEPRSIDEFCRLLRDHIQLLRPVENVSFSMAEGIGDIAVQLNQSLVLALANLIENSLQSNSDDTHVSFNLSERKLLIEISDNGSGLPDEVKNQLGQTFISTKQEGWGMGVYLSNSTIEHFGGTISMINRPHGGTLTTVSLPAGP